MSSHHIVREQQEPALIIEDLRGIPANLLNELLEWSPTVIAIDELVTQLISQQIKVDVAIGSNDPRGMQDTIRFIHKKARFLTTAVQYLVKQGYHAAYLLSSDTNPASLLAHLPQLTITLFSQNIRFYPVRSGFSKWKPKGDTIYIEDTRHVQHIGLEAQGRNRFLTTGDGFFSLSFPQEYLVIGENYADNLSQHD